MPAHQVDLDLNQRKIAREFIAAYGSENQYERFMAGLLPESELMSLARHHLFAPFAEFRRWAKIEDRDMRHERTCAGGEVRFITQKPDTLTHDEWSIFKKIGAAVSVANNARPFAANNITATVELVEHVGRCSACEAEVYGRAASIRIIWAGRPLSREYTLEAP
jgi:hypothetical protein